MVDEPDTPVEEAGTDNVEPSQPDTVDDWDYLDPDEDQDTEDTPQEEATDDEEGEPEEAPKEESEDEPDRQEDGPPAEMDAVVKLADGTETTVGDLVKGNLRQADFTRKTQELAERRKAVSADASRAEKITEALIDKLAQFLPEAPDESLAYSNPAQFNAMKAQHDSAVKRMQEIVSIADEAKGVQQNISAEERRERFNTENQQLVEMFPQAGTKEGRQKFFTEAAEAAKKLGFSDKEVQGQMDHRMFALAHYANIGLQAEAAKKTAKAKLAKVSPTARPKPSATNSKSKQNRDAMKRLMKSGSIDDALSVDFDF